MRNFFWEGHKRSKINHLVNWDLVTRSQADGGLGFGGLKATNMALLAYWGWRYFNEENSLRCQVVRSIHGNNTYNQHTKANLSLRSPWISISRNWLNVEAFAIVKVRNGSKIAFWLDPWIDLIPLSLCYPKLFKIAIHPNGSVYDHWDASSSSWSISFRWLLKDDGITDFQSLIYQISNKKVAASEDRRVWSLEALGKFSVKSLANHLSPSSTIDKRLFKARWKTKSPRRVDILVWINSIW